MPEKINYNLPIKNPFGIREENNRSKDPMYLKKYGKRQDYTDARNKEREIKNKPIIDAIINSEIDFSKLGWVSNVSKIIGISPSKVSKWMKRNMIDFYKSRCFIRCKPVQHNHFVDNI